MTTSAHPVVPIPSSQLRHNDLTLVWPDHGRTMPRASGLLALVAATVAAVIVPHSSPGLGLVALGLLIAAAVGPEAAHRVGPHEITFGLLATALLMVVAVRSAEWLVSLSLLGTVGAASYALTSGRSAVSVVLAAVSLPLAWCRGLPWMWRGVRTHVPVGHAARDLLTGTRAIVVTFCVVLVFGALFSSADAAFAHLVPSLDLSDASLRVIVFCFVAALTTSNGISGRASAGLVPVAAGGSALSSSVLRGLAADRAPAGREEAGPLMG